MLYVDLRKRANSCVVWCVLFSNQPSKFGKFFTNISSKECKYFYLVLLKMIYQQTCFLKFTCKHMQSLLYKKKKFNIQHLPHRFSALNFLISILCRVRSGAQAAVRGYSPALRPVLQSVRLPPGWQEHSKYAGHQLPRTQVRLNGSRALFKTCVLSPSKKDVSFARCAHAASRGARGWGAGSWPLSRRPRLRLPFSRSSSLLVACPF